MADQLTITNQTTGLATVVAVRLNADGQWWNTSGSPAFETYNAANIANYGIAMSEVGATGVYTVDDPAPTVEGSFIVAIRAGASLAVSDLLTAVGQGVAGPVAASEVLGAVGSVTGNVGGNVVGSVASVTGNVGGNVVGSVGSVTGAVASVTNPVTVGTNNDKTGYSLTAGTGLGNQTADITGSLSGSVGSVTGAVGSVTGNVGGNVVGSVASVVGAVGSVTGNVGGNVTGSVGSVLGGINTTAGTIQTLDALDTAQDTQHVTTQTYLTNNLGAAGAAATEAGGTGDHLTATPWNASWDTEVQSEVNDALVAFWTSPATLVDLVWDEVLTGATHNVAQSAGRRLRGLQDFTSYDGGAVWIDTLNGTAGTSIYENGTPDNPVDSLADATTLASSANLKHFHLANGSVITLAAPYDNFEFEGDEYTIALGGQSIANTSIKDALLISGIYSGYPHILRSIVGGITGPGAKIGMCAIRGAVVLNANTNIMVMHDCWTSNAALAAMDFGSGVAANVVYVANYNGAIEVRNMATGDTLWFSGRGTLTLAASCTGGTVNVSGNVDLVNNGSGLTISDTARMSEDQVQAFADAALTAYDPPTNAEMVARTLVAADYFDPAADTVARVTLVDTTTSNSDMRGTDNAALATALATAQTDLDTLTGTDGVTLATSQPNYAPATTTALATVDTVVDGIKAVTDLLLTATGTIDNSLADATTTVFKTNLVAVNDFYNDQQLLITSGSLAGQVKPISDFAQTNGVITLAEGLTTAPANGVTFAILAVHVHSVSQIQSGLATATALQTVDDELGTLATTVNSGNVVVASVTGAVGSVTDPVTAGTVNDKTGYSLDTNQMFNNTGTFTGDINGSVTGSVDSVTSGVTLAASQPLYTPAVAGDAMALTSGERTTLAGAILDLANGVETSITLRQAQRLILAAATGKLAGAATTTITIRDSADSKDRITATVDSDGNRTAVTLDAS